MIEAGLVALVQQGIAPALPGVPGGFAVQLPKDQISSASAMAWTYRCIVAEPTYTLQGQDPFTGLELQIDCHGYAMADAIALARAVEWFRGAAFRAVRRWGFARRLFGCAAGRRSHGGTGNLPHGALYRRIQRCESQLRADAGISRELRPNLRRRHGLHFDSGPEWQRKHSGHQHRYRQFRDLDDGRRNFRYRPIGEDEQIG